MFRIFQEERLISALMGLFLVLGLLTKLGLGLIYTRMIKETDNMATTDNKKLKQCKAKFSNCFQLNNGVSNIPIFVDKFINRLSFGKLSLDGMYHLSGQLMLLSVVCAGIGVCKSIVSGRTLGEILPFYIVSFLGLYLYFSVSAIVDIKGKKRVLKVNLIDYLENHLSARMDVTQQDLKMLYGEDLSRGVPGKIAPGSVAHERVATRRVRLEVPIGRRTKSVATGFTREQEKELEELLMDFL